MSIPYEIHRRRRKTVGVTVRKDGSVDVHAPLRASQATIREVVERFRPWIERKRAEHLARERRRRARRYEDGEEIRYLGRGLRLEVVEVEGVPVDPPRRRGSVLRVRVAAGLTAPSRRAVTRYAVGRWMLDEARDVLHKRHVRAAQRVGASAKRVVIKDMKSRWGSCGPKRNMSLSWRLVMAPLSVIDYVITHELTHIFVPDHSAKFWRRVEEACPDYRASRQWLNEHGPDLEL